MNGIIYGLVDPRCSAVRYIGKSIRGMVRPAMHMQPGNTRPQDRAWISDVRAAGLEPEIVVLEWLDDASSPACGTYWPDSDRRLSVLNAAEIWWIVLGRAFGWDLTNATDGGEGSLRAHPTVRARMSRSAKARPPRPPMPETTREKIGSAHRGKKQAPEDAARNRARLLSPGVRAAALEASKNLPSEVRSRIREATVAWWQTPPAGKHKQRLAELSRARTGIPLPKDQSARIGAGVKAFWSSPAHKKNHMSGRPETRAAARERMLARWATVPPPTCGTTRMYGHGCRCEACRTAHQVAHQKHLDDTPKPCGTIGAYDRGCRCEPCRDAKRTARRNPIAVRKPCGTTAGYERGCRCDRCSHTMALKAKAARDEKRGGPPKTIAGHGTYPSYARGCRCDPCREAKRAYRKRNS